MRLIFFTVYRSKMMIQNLENCVEHWVYQNDAISHAVEPEEALKYTTLVE